MSRSKKKYAIVKDKTNHKWYNRIFRRVNKMRVKNDKDPYLMNDLIPKYDVCDWIFTFEDSDDTMKEKIKRK